MISIDELLTNYTKHRLLQGKNEKHDHILNGLSKQLKSNVYLTERQASLAVKILGHNKEFFPEAAAVIENPTWQKSFRVITRFAYLTVIRPQPNSQPIIEIGYNLDKNFSKKLEELRKDKFLNELIRIKNHVWHLLYTELDLYHLIKSINCEKFKISQEILDAYTEISEILQNSEKYQFFIGDGLGENLKNKLNEELESSIDDSILIEDRKIKYQYQISGDFPQKTEKKSLFEKIANRSQSKIFVSTESTNMTELISALGRLDRFPCMIIFDNDSMKSTKNLKILKESLDANNVDRDVGIYFRFDASDNGNLFNGLIKQYSFNKVLNNNTAIVGITNQKIPKFLLRMEWQPRSVLVISSHLGSNRVNIYANTCDLMIYFQDRPPLREKIEEIS